MSGSEPPQPAKRHKFRRTKRSRLWRQNLAREQLVERAEEPTPPAARSRVAVEKSGAESAKKKPGQVRRRAETRSDPPQPTTHAATAGANRRVGFITMGVSALLVAGGVYLAARGSDTPVPGPTTSQAPPVPRQIMDVVPRGATIVVTADLRALRSSPLVAPYLGGQSLPGLGDVPRICGFDPIAMVDQIAIAVPQEGEADFGIAALGGFSDSSMTDCARKIVDARGGRSLVSSSGPFRSVRDAASPSAGEIAVKSGLLLWGGGQYLRTMVSTADGTQPGLPADSFHSRMRAELSGYETAQATILLSDSQRANVADEITKAQGSKEGGRPPVALAYVSGAALGVRLVGDAASLLLVVVADKASQSGEVKAWLESMLVDAAQGMTAKLLGLAPLVERIRLSIVGTTVRAELDASVAELETVVDRAMTLRNLLRDQPLEQPPGPQPESPPATSASASASAAPSASVAPSSTPPEPHPTASASSTSAPPPKKRKPKPEQAKPEATTPPAPAPQ